MRDRNACRRRDGRDGRHAGHDLEVDSGFGERERLLSAPAEDERISSLQADDLEVAPAQRHEQSVDLGLPEGIARDTKGVCGCLIDELGTDQSVVDERVARSNELEAFDRDEPGITRPRADEIDGHGSSLATRSAKNRFRSS
jgi:hypothetical protein